MKTSRITATLLGLLCLTTLLAQDRVTRLRTEYQTTPMGLEVNHPRLSWQMQSDRYGAAQTAYRVVAATSEEALKQGTYSYDTDKVTSDASVAIPYEGALKATTRYFWQVFVWDERGKMLTSEPTWFETGLMYAGWNGAKWIGSNEVILSKYRMDFTIDYDVQAQNDEAVFVFGAKDEQNFSHVSLNIADKTLTFGSTVNGTPSVSERIDVSGIIGNDPASAVHHVQLVVSANTVGKNYSIRATLDGQAVKDGTIRLTVDNGLPNSNSDRLDEIGYAQPDGQKATFFTLSVSESRWGTTFVTYRDIVADGFRTWNPTNASAPMLRKTIRLEKPVANARLYASARGIYEVHINGQKASDDYYNPGWPEYKSRIYYNTFDVTHLLKQGDNGIGVELAAGWWNDVVGMTVDPYGVAQSFLGKLVVTYADGTKKTFVTDQTWKVYDDGPVIINGMQTGEEYDARKEVEGWSTAAFDDSAWKAVKLFDAPSAQVTLTAYVGETIKNRITLTAQSMTEPRPGVYVYDMGVNMVGIPRLTHLNGKAGQKVTLRFAEMLWPETLPVSPIAPYTLDDYRQNRGLLYTDNYRGALSRDVYYLKGVGNESFEPYLTQHGYRYIEITGLDAPLALEDVKGLVLESIGEQLSHYETSNPDINQLFQNVIWGQRGNFLSVPTDCPQRDERMGWTGDAQIFVRTSTYNMMTDGFFTRWMHGMRDSQGDNGSYPMIVPAFTKGGDNMGWMEAGIICPWEIYQQYGDLRILEEHYASMTKYMSYLERRATDYIQPGGMFGDWLSPTPTRTALTNSAWYAYDALLMTKIATSLGKAEDAEKYARLYQDIKTAWNREFVDADGYTQSIGHPSDRSSVTVLGLDLDMGDLSKKARVDTQTSYVMPLAFDLFTEENKPKALKRLVELIWENGYRLTTGFIGTPYLCVVLSDNGYSDVAYKLFQQTEYPSWLFPVLQGATTIWERWNSYTVREGFGPVSMNSFNHYSYGAIESWMMSHTLGIERDELLPGYKHIVLKPEFCGDFDYIRGGFEGIYGKIESGWQKVSGGYDYQVTVPANTTATLTLPSAHVSQRIGKKAASTVSGGQTVYELKAGRYVFHIHS